MRLGLISEPPDDALWSVSGTDVSEAPIDVDFVARRSTGHIARDHRVYQLAVAVTGKPAQLAAQTPEVRFDMSTGVVSNQRHNVCVDALGSEENGAVECVEV